MPPRPKPDELEEPDFGSGKYISARVWDQPAGTHDLIFFTRLQLGLFQGHLQYNMERFFNFMLSRSDISSAETWEPVKPLGAGGAGIVALWAKKDEQGTAVDEIAIKQQKFVEVAEAPGLCDAGIEYEAVVQVGLQDKARHDLVQDQTQLDSEGHILHLRRYKYHTHLDQSRQYYLFAPHGTLDDLISHYRAFGRILPREFLWVLLHSLALAMKTMGGPLLQGALLHEARGRTGSKNDYMLHCDLKPMNVLLDYAAMPDEELDRHLETSECPDDFTRMYPKVCVADFGLVFDTRTDVLPNPPPGAGTLGYRPPEQIGFGVGHNSRRFARPPNPERYKHTTAHNVWGIGKVLFDAMTGFGFKVIQNALDNLEEAKYEERGGHFLSRRWVDEYTDVELANLVHQCLSPQAAQRPSLDDILNQTSAKIKELQQHLENAGTETMRKARLYFREKELNYLVPGPRLADFECNDYTYLQVRFRNPEVPVDLPEAIWGDWLRENSGRLAQLYPGEHRKVTGKGQVSLGDHGEVIPADNDGLVDPIRTGANRDIPDKLPVFQQPPRPRTVDRQSVPQPPPNQNMGQPPMVHQGQVPPQPVPQAQTDQQRRYQQGIDGIDNYPVAHMLAQPHLQNVQPWGGGNAEPGSSRDVAPIINSETGSAHQPFVGNVQPRGNGNVGRLASNDVGPDLTALGRNFNFSSRPPSRRQRSRRPSPQMKIEHQSEQRPRLSQMVGVTRQRMRSPPPPSTIADDDAALKLYEEADMKGLRAECKHRKLSVKLAGKGITKKFLAKALVRADRAGNTGRGVPKKKKKKLQGSKGRRKR